MVKPDLSSAKVSSRRRIGFKLFYLLSPSALPRGSL
jgi:hypothetical protein